MSSEKKTILFNDLVLSNKTRKNNVPKKEKPIGVIKPNVLKKKLLEKIKLHQQNEKIRPTKKVDEEPLDDDFQHTFMESLDYLNKLHDKHTQQKLNKKNAIQNKTQKRSVPITNKNHSVSSEHLISIDLPSDFDKPALKLNNMNNENKQTMSLAMTDANKIPSTTIIEGSRGTPASNSVQHASSTQRLPPTSQNKQPDVDIQPITQTMPRTQISTPNKSSHTANINAEPVLQNKNIYPAPVSIIHNKPNPSPPYGCLKGGVKPTYREYHNKTIKNPSITQWNIRNYKENNVPKHNHTCKKIKQVTRKTKKSTFKLGRHGQKISVLIKNNSTRRKIMKEHGILKQKPMSEVKKYLYDKNLIKIGSTAPNEVLRTLYEQTILAGDINNINTDIALHNFVNP